jgi:DNA modification methylase
VLDSFAGSGTTILAAERTGRRSGTLEIDPHYVDVAVRRWIDVTEQPARLATTGQNFAEVEAERVGAPAAETADV